MIKINVVKTYQNNTSCIGQKEIFNLSEFVVTENFNYHTHKVLSSNWLDDIDSVYEEEISYLKDSRIFIFKSETAEIKGTIRVFKWDLISPMPIQKMFEVNPFICNDGNNINEIWHIGRFAIRKGTRDINLLKKLLVCALESVCTHKDNIAFAEIDAKLLRVLTMMGIKAKVAGKSIQYLGSETIPVCLPYNGLIDFYNENKHLVSNGKTSEILHHDINYPIG